MHRASSRRVSPKSGRFLYVAIHPIVMVEAEFVIVFTLINIAITTGTTQECSLAPHIEDRHDRSYVFFLFKFDIHHRPLLENNLVSVVVIDTLHGRLMGQTAALHVEPAVFLRNFARTRIHVTQVRRATIVVNHINFN